MKSCQSVFRHSSFVFCKRLRFVVLILVTSGLCYAQSKTTETLQGNNKDASSFFFYNNTLRMLNQKEDKDFDELIKDIEKMKFLKIDKETKNFDYKKLVGEYKSEAFQEVMTSRHEGKSFDVFIKEKNGKTKGMLILIDDSTNLYVLDILGRIALNKVTKLYTTLTESADLGKHIKAVVGDKKEQQKSQKKQ